MISTLRASRRPLPALAVLLSLTTALPASAATLVTYDFEDNTGNFSNTPEAVAAHLGASSWSDTSGTLTNAKGNPATGFALSAKSFKDGNSLSMTLTPEAGFRLSLSGITFDQLASGTGPKLWRLRLNGLDVAQGSPSASFKSEDIALGVTAHTGPLVMTLEGAGASSNAGTFRLDNVVIRGDLAPVPVPGAVGLFGSALMGLFARRRRNNTLE